MRKHVVLAFAVLMYLTLGACGSASLSTGARTGLHQSVFNASPHIMRTEVVGARFLGDIWWVCGVPKDSRTGEVERLRIKASAVLPVVHEIFSRVMPCEYGPFEEDDFFFVRSGGDRQVVIKILFFDETWGRDARGEKYRVLEPVGYDLCQVRVGGQDHRYRADVCEAEPRFR